MVPTTPRKRAHRTPHRITPDAYADFIRQIELEEIWLEAVDLQNERGPETPARATVQVGENDASYELQDRGFQVNQVYYVQVQADADRFAGLYVDFGLRFTSKEPMTDEIFKIFREVNLPVNTWPYLREFVSSMTGRMGWAPVTLPALKRGTEPAAANRIVTPRPSTRSRRGNAHAE